jgi:DinB superfamily
MSDTISETKGILTTTAARWTALTSSLPADALTHPAAPGEWSAAHCLSHLLDTEAMVFPVRLRAFLEGKDAFDAFEPDSEGTDRSGMTPAQLAAEFARHRADNLALLEQATSDLLERKARHSELGPVTFAEFLEEWAAHDLNHTVQAERAVMQPFIAGSGPWRSSFADHDLGM